MNGAPSRADYDDLVHLANRAIGANTRLQICLRAAPGCFDPDSAALAKTPTHEPLNPEP